MKSYSGTAIAVRASGLRTAIAMMKRVSRMDFIDYVSLSPIRKLAYRTGKGVRNLPRVLKKVLISVVRKIRSGFVGLKNGVKEYLDTFVQGDFKTRLSYFIMGSGSFLRGQYVKEIGRAHV